MKKFCIALALVSASLFMGSSAKADVIAELFDDFTAPAATGWSYLWNPAGVSIGDSANYLAIPLNGSTFNETTALEAVGTNGDNGNHVDLRVAGGTPSLRVISGLDAAVTAAPGDGIDHYTIARYTIQPGEAGTVTFDSSRISFGNNAGNRLEAYLNDVLVGTVTGPGNQNDFSFNFGAVNVGDTLDLAFLTPDNNGATRNARRFFVSSAEDHEFNRVIAATVPEPSALALLGLGVLGLCTRRRR